MPVNMCISIFFAHNTPICVDFGKGEYGYVRNNDTYHYECIIMNVCSFNLFHIKHRIQTYNHGVTAGIRLSVQKRNMPLHFVQFDYRKISDIRRTKSQDLNESHLVLQSSLPDPAGVKSRM